MSNGLFHTIKAITGHDNKVSVERLYCEAMGRDLSGGMFLSELIFWCDKGKRADGFFYRSAAEWEERCYLSTYLVRKYTKFCEDLGWLETKLMKANGSPTVHYRVDAEKFSKWICEFSQNSFVNFDKSLTDTTTDTTTEEKTSFSNEKDTPPPSEKPKTPRKPKTPKAEKTEPPVKEPTEHQEMFGALCTLVGWDYKTITKDQKGQVAQALGVLEKAGYTMDSLRAFFMHWRNKDWRGRKGETPTLSQVRSEIGKIKTTTTNGINWEKHHAINVANYTPTQYDLAEITF